MSARILVDELQKWPTAIPCLKRGSCFLTVEHDADGVQDFERLHAFAASLGLRREWFEEHATAPHYKLSRAKRRRALKLGAVYVHSRVQATARLLATGKITQATAARML